MSICEFQLHDKAKRVLITDVTKATSTIVEQRLMNQQFRNDDELHADQLLETAKAIISISTLRLNSALAAGQSTTKS